MHAVIVSVTINDGEKATTHLRNEIVPRVKQAPGFVAGYWVRVGEGGEGASGIPFQPRALRSESSTAPRVRTSFAIPRGRRVGVVCDWDEEGFQDFLSDPDVPAIFQRRGPR